MEKSTVDSVAGVIEALGGGNAFRRRYGISSQTLWNWRNAGCFPPLEHARMQADLAQIGVTADPALWRQREPSSEAAE